MDHPASDKIKAFVSGFKGKALTVGDPDYDSSRAIWNGAFDRKPAVIARCAKPQDVAAAVRFARDSDLEISVRGGGHNYCRERCRRRRPDDPSRRDERSQRRPGRAPRQMRRRRHLGRCRCGDAAARAGDAGRLRQPYRGRGAGAWRRHRLADQEGRAQLRQSARGGGRDRGWAHRASVIRRKPGPVVGAERRRRKLRHRHLVRVRAPSDRADGSIRARSSSGWKLARRRFASRAITSTRCPRTSTASSPSASARRRSPLSPSNIAARSATASRSWGSVRPRSTPRRSPRCATR